MPYLASSIHSEIIICLVTKMARTQREHQLWSHGFHPIRFMSDCFGDFKAGRVHPMVAWTEFRLRQYKDGYHRGDARLCGSWILVTRIIESATIATFCRQHPS